MKKITQFSLFFILFISLFKVDAQSFTQFRGLGADDSAELGFKTISTNSVLVVSNNATGTTGSIVGSELFSKLTTAGGTDVITLKADGENAVSFDVNDLSVFNYLDPASDADYTTNTKIVFKNAVGTTIRTMTLSGTKSLTSSTSGVSIGAFFDNNASLPVTGVSEIEITINPSTVSVDAFTIKNITLSNIVSGAVPSGPATLDFNTLGITNTISNTLGKSTAIGPLNFEINSPNTNDLITYKANEGAAGTGALYDNNADIGGITKWTINRHDGSEFTLSSIYLQEAGVGASTSGTLKARRNGAQVGSTVNVTFSGDIDVSGNPDFTNIDEVWIEATDINFYLDNVAYVIPSTVVMPTVTTTAASNVTTTTATLSGNVTDNGGAIVTDRGIVYNTTGAPTTADTKVQIGTGDGIFSDEITGLTAETTYYIRAYAVNSEGTSYGSEESFTTDAPSVLLNANPTISFSNDDGFSDSKAVDGEGGSVSISDIDIEVYPINSSGTALTADPLEYHDNDDWPSYPPIITYGATLKHYGWAIKSANGDNFSLESLDFMDWGTWDGATFIIEAFDNGSSKDAVTFTGNTDESYVNLSQAGILSSAFSNVDEIRFYKQGGDDTWTALNNIEVNSPVISVLATVTTSAASSITATTATLGGNVTDNGGATVTDRGIVYNTTGTPTTADTKVQIGTGDGIFSDEITGLTAETTYYVRAYAINSEGTSYGSEESFTTSPTLSLEDDYLKNAISLYPNPVNDVLYITNTIKVENVVLFDVLGKRIDTIKMENDAINLSNIETGIYILKIETEGGDVVKRIIKE